MFVLIGLSGSTSSKKFLKSPDPACNAGSFLWVYTKRMKTSLIAVATIIVGAFSGYYFGYDIGYEKASSYAINNAVNSYEECLAYTKGQAIIAIYPPQCGVGGKTFTQDIGNELEVGDKIISEYPRPGDQLTSPVTIKGTATGSWFFEASFGVELYDGNGIKIASGIAETKDEWMTEDFISYESVLTFAIPSTTDGYLLLKKDNPSGLTENDNFLRVPVTFR